MMISVSLMNTSHTQQKPINVSWTPPCDGICGNTPFWCWLRLALLAEPCKFTCKTEQLFEIAAHEQSLYSDAT